MNILLVKKYYHLIKNKYQDKLNFTYSPLGKAVKKQIKTIIECQGKKQVDALEALKLKELGAIKDN